MVIPLQTINPHSQIALQKTNDKKRKTESVIQLEKTSTLQFPTIITFVYKRKVFPNPRPFLKSIDYKNEISFWRGRLNKILEKKLWKKKDCPL